VEAVDSNNDQSLNLTSWKLFGRVAISKSQMGHRQNHTKFVSKNQFFYNFFLFCIKLSSNAEESAIKSKEHLVILFAVRNHLLPRAVRIITLQENS
jgi:hypothetical protein